MFPFGYKRHFRYNSKADVTWPVTALLARCWLLPLRPSASFLSVSPSKWVEGAAKHPLYQETRHFYGDCKQMARFPLPRHN